jgi:hypothetical protein
MSRSPAQMLVFAAIFVLVCLAVGPAAAEQAGRAGVRVSLDGRVSPNVLPRHDLRPVSVLLSGSVGSSGGETPPRLRRIEVAIGAGGGLDAAGLAVCPRSRLRNATRDQAMSRCGEALVGHGSILAEVPLAPDRPLLTRARALAFNAREDGRRAVLVHAYSASPPVSFVLPFTLRILRRGTYGVRLEAPVARALGRWPRLRSFRITLGRRYRSHGRRHSYLNAHCPLPRRFGHLDVPFARATYSFAPAPEVSISISRPCRVRE